MTKKGNKSLWKRWHINAVVAKRQKKTSKPVVSKRVRCLSWFSVFTCWILSHYYLDVKLALFLDWASQQHILLTVTKVLDEELIRICTRRTKTSIGMRRHLYSLSHLLVGFMLYEFSLFILCGTSDVWLDLRMPPGAPSRNVNYCEMEMLHFCNILHLAQWDSPGRYHLGGWHALWSWSIVRQTDGAFLWSHSSGTEVLMHKLSYRHIAH